MQLQADILAYIVSQGGVVHDKREFNGRFGVTPNQIGWALHALEIRGLIKRKQGSYYHIAHPAVTEKA